MFGKVKEWTKAPSSPFSTKEPKAPLHILNLIGSKLSKSKNCEGFYNPSRRFFKFSNLKIVQTLQYQDLSDPTTEGMDIVTHPVEASRTFLNFP
jgi:hypothetical protein